MGDGQGPGMFTGPGPRYMHDEEKTLCDNQNCSRFGNRQNCVGIRWYDQAILYDVKEGNSNSHHSNQSLDHVVGAHLT